MSFSGYFPQNSKQFALFRAVFVTDECSTIELPEDWKRKFPPKVQKYISRQDKVTRKSIGLDQVFIAALVEDDITTAQVLCKCSSGISIHH